MYAFTVYLIIYQPNEMYVLYVLHPVCPPVVISLLRLGPNIKLQHRIFLPSYHFIHTRNSTHVLTPHNRSQKMDILSKWFGTNDTYVYINHVICFKHTYVLFSSKRLMCQIRKYALYIHICTYVRVSI